MNQTFENLSEEKKKKIMECCMEEFAKNGYENASTNTIVRNAEISKGILFHYFGNKKKLFLYMLDRVLERSIARFNELNQNPAADVFERLVQRSQIKLQMANEDPYLYEITTQAFLNTPKELQPDITERYQKLLAEETPLAFQDVDVSKFREGVDPKNAMDLILLSMEGLFNKYMHIYRAQGGWNEEKMKEVVKESLKYLEMIKYGIYAKE